MSIHLKSKPSNTESDVGIPPKEEEDYGIPSEWLNWYALTPEERWSESGRLRNTFLMLGGSLEPEPDTESPFFDESAWRPQPAHGRSGVRILRSCGI